MKIKMNRAFIPVNFCQPPETRKKFQKASSERVKWSCSMRLQIENLYELNSVPPLGHCGQDDETICSESGLELGPP